MQMPRTMEPNNVKINNVETLKMNSLSLFLILFFTIIANTVASHIEAVSCSQRADCLAVINEEVVATIRSHMHIDTHACENFWDYACGDWTAAPYYDHVDTFGAIGNFYRQQLSDYLSEDSEDYMELRPLFKKLRIYYSACVTSGGYFLPMTKYLRERPEMPNLGWPQELNQLIMKRRSLHNFNWLHAIAELRRFGLNDVLLSEDVGFASQNSRRYVIALSMPDGADVFRNQHEVLQVLEEFNLMQGSANKSQLQLIADIFGLETQLLELRAKHSHSQKPLLTMNLSELRVKLGNIDWQSYFNILIGEEASQALPIELENMDYLLDLASLLADTEDHIVSRYILARLSKFLLSVRPHITPRNCVEHMEVYMALGMDFLYDYKFYKTRAEDAHAIENIFQKLRRQFLQYMERNKLQLSAEEIDYLRQKLLKMSWRLGNLPAINDASFYNDYYSDAEVITQSFFRNHWEMLRHRTHKQHERLLAQNFTMATYFVNDDIRQVRNAPYFVHQRNLLIVPLNFVQMPFYDHRLHPLLQQSIMGWILAHEMNHGFEVDGIVLDADGNRSSLGAEIKQHASFQAAVQCMHGTRTASLIERMADINGFQLAYDAYSSQLDSLVHPTFAQNFSAKQLYFLNFAQFFCGLLPTAIDHDRDDVRVNQIVANMPEFARVFKCAHNAPANPLHKCQMWR